MLGGVWPPKSDTSLSSAFLLIRTSPPPVLLFPVLLLLLCPPLVQSLLPDRKLFFIFFVVLAGTLTPRPRCLLLGDDVMPIHVTLSPWLFESASLCHDALIKSTDVPEQKEPQPCYIRVATGGIVTFQSTCPPVSPVPSTSSLAAQNKQGLALAHL